MEVTGVMRAVSLGWMECTSTLVVRQWPYAIERDRHHPGVAGGSGTVFLASLVTCICRIKHDTSSSGDLTAEWLMRLGLVGSSIQDTAPKVTHYISGMKRRLHWEQHGGCQD